MIRHSVFFKFKSSVDSDAAQNFFIAAKKLAAIPGVQNFEILRQISKKNNYEFGLSMEFANADLYQQYNNHPMHVQFIKDYWMSHIEDFLEIDYEPLK
jgi:stress responsive alpha/beta barrel protein